MDAEQRSRFEALKEGWCTPALLDELLGIPAPLDDEFWKRCRAWCESVLGIPPVNEDTNKVHRYAIETFLLEENITTRKRAALEFGMTDESLAATLSCLRAKSLIESPNAVTEYALDHDLVSSIHKKFRGTRDALFGSHTSFCRRLHEAIRDELDVEITAVFDVTSSLETEGDCGDYSFSLDHITLEPLGIRYKVYLDTEKPINLEPELCSVKTYYENSDFLEEYMLGGPPVIPPWLMNGTDDA